MSEEVIHYDRLGNKLKIDDYVAFTSQNSLKIGLIIKLNPKTVQILHIDPKTSRRQSYIWPPKGSKTNKYPEECVIVSGPLVTMYLLKEG